MLNMLKFRDKRLYFEEYIPAFNRVAQHFGIEGVGVYLVSTVVANIIAPQDEVWDAVALVEYPSAEAFKTIAESEAYHNMAEPLRLAALEDLKLFMTRRSEV